jgi:hypothetical protein
MSGRKLTTAVTLAVLLVVLAAMAIVGFQQAMAPLPSLPSAEETCSAEEKEVQRFIRRNQVQVSVFNAGTRQGLAGTTLERLEEAGFRAGNSGNAPRSAKVRRAAVWTTEKDDRSARLVALAFGKRTRIVVTEQDLGPGVDVLVGNRFKGLKRDAPRRIRLAQSLEKCIPVE